MAMPGIYTTDYQLFILFSFRIVFQYDTITCFNVIHLLDSRIYGQIKGEDTDN